MKHLPYFVVGSIFSLSGCLEVEDNSNESVAEALNEQNALMTEQNSLINAQLETSYQTYYGRLVNSLDNQAISSATVTLLAGSDFSKSVTPSSDGSFSFDNIPNGQVYILISSTESAFAPRLLSVDAYRQEDLGTIELSESHQVQFNVINKKGETVKGLEFYAHNYTNQHSYRHPSENLPSVINQVRLASTFDEATGQYLIDLPKYQDIDVLVKLDTDNDGIADFSVDTASHSFSSWENSSDSLPVNTTQFTLRNSNQVELSLMEAGEIELRFSIQYNTSGVIQTLTNAKVFGPSSNSNKPISRFNEDLQQHIIKLPRKSNTRLSIPAFEEGNLSFSSSLYDLTLNNEIISLSSSHGNTIFSRPLAEVLDAVVTLEPFTPDLPEINVLSAGFANNESVDIYYSQPISVFDEQAITFERLSPQIIREADSNAVLIDVSEQSISRVHETSLNNTKLSLNPLFALTEGFYQFNVADIEVQKQGEFDAVIRDASGDSGSFYFSSNTAFNVEEIVADNLRSDSDSSGSVRLLFPMTIHSLSHLTINVTASTEEGTSQEHSDSYTIVENGSTYYYGTNLSYTVTVADNEYAYAYSSSLDFNALTNSSLSEGQFVYSTGLYSLHLADNTETSKNDVTIQYSYTTKAGESNSGSITLPIK